MRNNFLLPACLLFILHAHAQTDTAFRTRVINFEWMPDGKNLVLGIMKFDNSRKLPPTSGVFIFNPESKKITPVVHNGVSPAASPDGNTIAYVKRDGGKNKIYLYDVAAKQERQLLNDTSANSSPQWSPDGKTIVYTQMTGTGNSAILDIYTIDVATQQTKEIAAGGKYRNYNPVWSTDGKWIVYYLEKGDNRDQIYLTDSKGSIQKNITNDTATHNFYPSWYGNKILYTRSPNRLATMNTDGSNREIIDGITTFFARYNAMQNKIAYIQMPDGTLKMYDVKNKTSDVLVDEKMISGLL